MTGEAGRSAEMFRARRRAERLRTLERTREGLSMSGMALASSPLPQDPRIPTTPPTPSAAGEVIAVGADQAFDPAGTFAQFVAVLDPPRREGFPGVELPTTELILTYRATYTVSLEVDWFGAPGGVVEVYVGSTRSHAYQSGSRSRRDVQIAAEDAGTVVRVALRHGGAAPVRAALNASVRLGHRTLEDYSREPDEEQPAGTVPTPATAPAVIAGNTLDNAYLDVSWDAVTGATGYLVIATRPDGVSVAAEVDADTLDTRLEWLLADTEYAVRVHALDEYGAAGDPSPETTVTTPEDETVPNQVTGLAVSAAFVYAVATWDDSPEIDVGQGQGRYELSVDGGAWYDVGWTLVANLGPFEAGSEHAMAVRAVDRSGNAGPATDPAPFTMATGVDVGEIDIVDLSVKAQHLADEAVTSRAIVEAAVETAKLADDAVTDAKVANLNASKITAGTIATARIDTAEIAADTAFLNNLIVGDAHITNDLNAAKITAGTIATARLDTAEIAADTAFLAALVVDTAQIANGAITNAKIDTLDAGKITAGTIAAERIGADTITVDKLTSSTLTSRTITLGSGGVFIAGDTTNGVRITNTGIQKFSGGVTTVNLPVSGDAVFSGDIDAARLSGEVVLPAGGSATGRTDGGLKVWWSNPGGGDIWQTDFIGAARSSTFRPYLSMHSSEPWGDFIEMGFGNGVVGSGHCLELYPNFSNIVGRLNVLGSAYRSGLRLVRGGSDDFELAPSGSSCRVLVNGGITGYFHRNGDFEATSYLLGSRVGVGPNGANVNFDNVPKALLTDVGIAMFHRIGNTCLHVGRDATNGNIVEIRRGTNINGSISVTTNNTSYNQTSDYRVKKFFGEAPVQESVDRIRGSVVERFKFRGSMDDGDWHIGYVAHHLQKVVPWAVTGEKDEEDDDGNPVYQGVDNAKLVPDLHRVVQHLLDRVDALDAQLAGTA